MIQLHSFDQRQLWLHLLQHMLSLHETRGRTRRTSLPRADMPKSILASRVLGVGPEERRRNTIIIERSHSD